MNIKILIPILLVAMGGTYKFAVAKTPVPEKKPKVEGSVYVLPKDFMINLEGGQFAKLGVALVMKEKEKEGKGKESAGPKPPEGYGTNPQEALVRSIVTDTLTGEEARRLETKTGRRKLQKEILEALEKKTDIEATSVVFTDVAVQ